MLNSSVTVEGSTFTAGGSTDAVVFGQHELLNMVNTRLFNVYNSVLDIPLGPVESTNLISGLYFNNDRVPSDALPNFFTVLEFVTNATQDASDNSRTVIPLLRGESSPGSQLLRGANWNE